MLINVVVIYIVDSGYFGWHFPWSLAWSWPNHFKYCCLVWLFYFLVHVNAFLLALNHNN